jgi:hypothetical protein
MDKLSANEIKTRIEAAFPMHRTVAEVWDYGDKVRFEVTADNGHVLATMPTPLVGDAESAAYLANVLHQVKEQVAKKAGAPVGLDAPIRVKGEKTTIRKEHATGRVKGLRGNNGPVTGQDPFGHWALIEGKSLPITAADHAFLRGDKSLMNDLRLTTRINEDEDLDVRGH